MERYVFLEMVTVVCAISALLLSSVYRCHAAADGELTDYCLHETLNATCPAADEVIVMERASFGRMRPGRCISGEGYIGCSANVLEHLDSLCSGRSACDVTVRNLVELQPCKRDFMPYLEASYRCVRVPFAQARYCPDENRGLLQEPVGYLLPWNAGVVGSAECPWSILVQPGLRLNLTLFDFTIGSRQRQSAASAAAAAAAAAVSFVETPRSSSSSCRMTVTVEENSARHDFSVCQTIGRMRHIYQSQANHIRIYVRYVESGWNDNKATYLIKYEALGCPTPAVPARGSMRRTGDTAIVKCNDTGETWYLTCKGKEWLGETGNCSKGNTLSSEHMARDVDSRLQYGIFIAIMIGIVLGVLTGSVLLVFVHILRHRSNRNKASSTDAMSMGMLPSEDACSLYATRREHHQIYQSPQQLQQQFQQQQQQQIIPDLNDTYALRNETFPVIISDTYGVNQSNYVCHHCGVLCASKTPTNNHQHQQYQQQQQQQQHQQQSLQSEVPLLVTDKIRLYECPYHSTPLLP